MKKMCDDYLVLIVHSPSPTINSSLNCGINDNKTPNVKAGIVPKYNDGWYRLMSKNGLQDHHQLTLE